MFPRLGLTCVALLALAACGGGEDAVSTTLPLPPETVATLPAETTDVEPAETTAAPTTNPTPTTSLTTTSTTTTEPFNELSDLAAAIERDLQAGEAALLEAAAAPGEESSRGLIRKYFIEEAQQSLLGFLERIAKDGLIGTPNPDVPSVVVLKSEPVLLDGTNTRAEARVCRVDAGMVVEVLSGGQVAIVDDEIVQSVALSQFELVDGIWTLAGGTKISDSSGVTTCD